MGHYSVDRAVDSKRRGEMQNVVALFVKDAVFRGKGYPADLRTCGQNSDVLVYDMKGKLLRKESQYGEVIERYGDK